MFLRKPKGFTLIELMVAMVVGLLVAGVAMAMYVSLIRANSTSIQAARLTQALQASLDVMERDLRRAGYMANAISSSLNTTLVNPATFVITDLQRVSAAAPLFDCVLIRYDSNADGVLSGSNEFIGYRYNGTLQAIEFKSWSTAATQQSERCINTGTAWEAITNNGFTLVTNLSFEISPSTGASTQGQRQVTITIVGRSKQNQALDMQLQREVRLRNDEY